MIDDQIAFQRFAEIIRVHGVVSSLEYDRLLIDDKPSRWKIRQSYPSWNAAVARPGFGPTPAIAPSGRIEVVHQRQTAFRARLLEEMNDRQLANLGLFSLRASSGLYFGFLG